MKIHFLLSALEISGEYFAIFACLPRDHKMTERFSKLFGFKMSGSPNITLMALDFSFALKYEYGFTFSCCFSSIETSSLANFPLQTLQLLM